MKKTKNYYLGLGIAIGMAVIGSAAVILFAITGDAVFLSFSGLGLVVGLILGDLMYKSKAPSDQDNQNEQDK